MFKKVSIWFVAAFLLIAIGLPTSPSLNTSIQNTSNNTTENHDHRHAAEEELFVGENSKSFHKASSKPWLKKQTKINIPEDVFDLDSFKISLDGKSDLEITKDKSSSENRSDLLSGLAQSYIGEIKSLDGEVIGKATLSKVVSDDGEYLSGFFELDNGERYSLVHNEEGELVLQELAPQNFPGCSEHAGAHPVHNAPSSADSFDSSTSSSGSFARTSSAGIPTIDVLVVYTPEARVAVGGSAAMQALVANSITVSNSAYADSQANVQVQLAHAAEVNYIESGNVSLDLARLKGLTDGYMDEVHALRDQYGADMVSLISNVSNYCGVAYQMNNLSEGYESMMFSLTYHGCSFANYSFPHELGHNMGAHHDYDTYSGNGLNPDSHGYHFGSWRSIMAYAPGTRVGRFSNPNESYSGYTTGLAGTADNVSTLEASASLVASFRSSIRHTISGTITSGGTPLAGVTVSAGSLGSRTTDSQGRYSFANVYDGTSYTIQASKTGYTLFPASYSGTANDNVTHDFAANIQRFTISGQVLEEGQPVSGVTISAGSLGSTVSNSSGYYSFSNVDYGTSYSITPSYQGEAFSPSSASGVLTSNIAHNFNKLGPVATISGQVTSNGFPLANVSITSATLGAVTTSSTGYFSFNDVPLGTSYSLSVSLYGYAFSQSRISGLLEENVSYSLTATLIDSDNDGLSDLEEANYGTDPNSVDTDGDGVSDAQEIQDGTNPTDRGSSMAPLAKNLCSEWNGFLGGMYNILELVNMSSQTLSLDLALYDINGVRRDLRQYAVAAGAQKDVLVHDLNGFELNAIGKVCVTHSGAESDLDGRMVYYKAELGRAAENRYEFAFAMPFENGIKGRQYVSYNTFQPSLDAADAANPVANWIQITNAGASTQAGTLLFYNIDGAEIARTRVTVPAGARRDVAGHQFGVNKVGLVEWVPDSSSAIFQLRNVRYVYDNNSGYDNFDAAFQLSGAIGSGERLTVPLDTSAGSAIVEVSNVLSSSTSVVVEIYNASGVRKAYIPITLRAKQSQHIITDSFLNGEKGIAIIKGSSASSIVAVAMQYGRTASMGINYMYGIQAVQTLGSVLRSSYNTYLNQGCSLILTNPTAYLRSASISMKRSNGFQTLSGMHVLVPAHGQAEVDICSMEEDNYYGVVTVQPTENNTLAGVVVRRGFLDGYRFPTPLR